ncbi:hypothetical protein B0F90DRAFT_1733204 [Multifurca ochricompacta]|uniref:DUF6534 domain-containing protein n=1 Tax=Multifurca ochricompacta TaxID=376703 RepID=A0AAD4M220_9AGAM|nr:hypothetical protein B0F90DRAFT_1733204 [Multifurca ochricompacta]
MFLAIRYIYHKLTQSRLQSGLVFAFSITAFIFGGVTMLESWLTKSSILISFTTPQLIISVFWHGLQAICEYLIMFFLARMLLSSRSGLRRTDRVVNHLVRHVIQIGLLATLWAIAGLVTWLLLPGSTVFVIFDMTSGSIYTHMIYDTLLSRKQWRERMGEQGDAESRFPTESHPHTFEENRVVRVVGVRNGAVSFMTMTDSTSPQNGERFTGNVKDDNSEFECAPVDKSATGYEFPYMSHIVE